MRRSGPVVRPELVERPGPYRRIEARVGEIRGPCAFGDRLCSRASTQRDPLTSRRRVIVAEAVWASRPGGQAVELGGETPSSLGRSGKPLGLRCSFCQAELGQETEPVDTAPGKQRQRTSVSRFCSARCRDCVLALEALNPSPLASYDFILRRGLLTDRLIDLWRSGKGPDPTLVLRAARSSSNGLSNPRPSA
jgi:hypothetical protein